MFKPKTFREAVMLVLGLNWALSANAVQITDLERDSELTDSLRGIKQKAAANTMHQLVYDVYSAVDLFMRTKFGSYYEAVMERIHHRLVAALRTAGLGNIKAHLVQYDHVRAYGGPEEGGWYYSSYEDARCIQSGIPYLKALALCDEYNERDKKACQTNRTQRVTFVEFVIGENETTHRPVYC